MYWLAGLVKHVSENEDFEFGRKVAEAVEEMGAFRLQHGGMVGRWRCVLEMKGSSGGYRWL